MMVAIIFVIIGLLGLGIIVTASLSQKSKESDLDVLASQLRQIDVDAFRNLVDADEDDYLRRHLPAGEFRDIQRERRLAAIEYVRCAANNSAVLMRLADAARMNPDPTVAEAAQKLFDNALKLRIYSLKMIPRLYVCVVFPSAGLSPTRLADTYDIISRQLIMLRCIRQPSRTASSVL